MKEEGFSLLEVVAAVAILSAVIIPVFSMFVGGKLSVFSGRHETEAVILAQEQMEELKGRGYGQLRMLMAGQERIETEDTSGPYARKVVLEVLPLEKITDCEGGEVIFIQITVSWSDGRGDRSITLSSFLGEGQGSLWE